MKHRKAGSLARQNYLEEVLSAMICIPSVYPKEAEMSSFLEKELRTLGFRINLQEVGKGSGRYNIFAQRGDHAKLMFYGHMDTVDVVSSGEWKYGPFEAVVKENEIYGLGSSDMKGGIAVILNMAQKTDSDLKVFFAVDEENWSEGAWAAVRDRRDFFRDIQLIISAEPGFGIGLNEVTRGRTGRLLYEVAFKGEAVHVFNYKEGIDALEKLSNFGSRLYLERETAFKSVDTVILIRKVSGEATGMSVCGYALAEIEVLQGKDDSEGFIMEVLRTFGGDSIELRNRPTPFPESYHFDDFPHMEVLGRIVERHTGKPMVLIDKKSVGDDNVFAVELNIPVVTLGPIGRGHIVNEYVERKSLEIVSNIYVDLINSVRI